MLKQKESHNFFIELLFGMVLQTYQSFCDILQCNKILVFGKTSFWNCPKLDFSLSLFHQTDIGYKFMNLEWLVYQLKCSNGKLQK